MVKDGDFVINNDEDDDMVHINPNISIKIIDFGLANRYRNIKNSFSCDRYGYSNTDYDQYKSPQYFSGDMTYSAMKVDVWAIAIIIYQMTFGTEPYNVQNEKDPYYRALIAGKINKCMKNISLPIEIKKLSLLKIMLKIKESDRCDISQVIKHDYFKSYYKRYGDRIQQQSQKQKLQNIAQSKIQTFFPYYDD